MRQAIRLLNRNSPDVKKLDVDLHKSFIFILMSKFISSSSWRWIGSGSNVFMQCFNLVRHMLDYGFYTSSDILKLLVMFKDKVQRLINLEQACQIDSKGLSAAFNKEIASTMESARKRMMAICQQSILLLHDEETVASLIEKRQPNFYSADTVKSYEIANWILVNYCLDSSRNVSFDVNNVTTTIKFISNRTLEANKQSLEFMVADCNDVFANTLANLSQAKLDLYPSFL